MLEGCYRQLVEILSWAPKQIHVKLSFALPVALVVASQVFFSCQKSETKQVQLVVGVPNDVITAIQAKGFSTDGIIAQNGGYVVEGDLFFTAESLGKTQTGPNLIVAQEEQYRTTNLVTGLPRTITVSVEITATGKTAPFVAATDSAIARYNKLGLRLTFQRIATGGMIKIVAADLGGGGVLGQSSGFPSAAGEPASPITLNSRKSAFPVNTDVQWLATVIAHEMGHTIGMRHTDYASRKYSCGFSIPGTNNEGQSGVGAIYIPGTESTPKDPASWMLACTDGTNRPFNANDVTALNYLYK